MSASFWGTSPRVRLVYSFLIKGAAAAPTKPIPIPINPYATKGTLFSFPWLDSFVGVGDADLKTDSVLGSPVFLGLGIELGVFVLAGVGVSVGVGEGVGEADSVGSGVGLDVGEGAGHFSTTSLFGPFFEGFFNLLNSPVPSGILPIDWLSFAAQIPP